MFQKLSRRIFQLLAVCCAILLSAAFWSPPVLAEDDVKNSEAAAAAQSPSLEVGMIAPDFTLADDTGAMRTLSEFLGKKNVVLAFYPKDFTGG